MEEESVYMIDRDRLVEIARDLVAAIMVALGVLVEIVEEHQSASTSS